VTNETPLSQSPQEIRWNPTHEDAARPRGGRFLLFAVRLIFVVLLVVVVTVTVASSRSVEEFGPPFVVGLILAAVGVGMVVLLLDVLTPNKKLTSVVGVYLGICLGLVAAVAFGSLIDIVAHAWDIAQGPAQVYLSLTKIIIGIVLCYLATSFVLTTRDDFRLVIPYVQFDRKPDQYAPVLLDSSALIDGRIEALAAAGLVDAHLVVPRFILDELQALCDSDDRHKRARGRRGLEAVERMQSNPRIDLRVQDVALGGRGADRMLVECATRDHFRIATCDAGLQRVAQISGLQVINLHEVSAALRPPIQQGEPITITVTRAGEQPGQGIGHLPDGTMVVVDGGAGSIGSEAACTITNVLQTQTGRIIFSRIDPPQPGSTESMGAAATAQDSDPTRRGDAPTRSGPARSSASTPYRNPRRA
jgi:uncharacterized protein YacL